jgi:amino acid adenylation domain-containing protein/non-ribosomal peptide synthase protein (TIGR01720 family)
MLESSTTLANVTVADPSTGASGLAAAQTPAIAVPRGLSLRGVAEWAIDEAVDLIRLEGAINRVVERHEILYGSAPPFGDVTDRAQLLLEVLDVSEIGSGAQRECLRRVRAEAQGQRAAGLDDTGARFLLVKCADARYSLFASVPSVCTDARSLLHLAAQVTAEYYDRSRALVTRTSTPQLRDVATWSAATLPDLKEAVRDVWARDGAAMNSETPWLLEPMVDRTATDFRVAVRPWRIPPAVTDGLWSHEDPVRQLEIALVSAAAAWLALVRGRERVAPSVSVEGRPYEELRDVIGRFERYVTVVVDVFDDTTAGELFDVVRGRLEDLDESTEGGETASRTIPLTNRESPDHSMCIEVRRDTGGWGERFRLQSVVSAAGVYGVKLACRLVDGEVIAEIQYDERRCSPAAIDVLAEQLTVLMLTHLCRDTVVRVTPFMGPRERLWRESLDEVSGPARVSSPEVSFERCATASPDAIAIVDGGCHVSYETLNRLADRLSQELRAKVSAAPETLIGVCLETSWQANLAILGVLKSGAAYLPIDPSWPEERTRSMVRDHHVSAIVVDEAPTSEYGVEYVRCDRSELAHGRGSAVAGHAPVSDDNLAYVLLTSGTSGSPKGVMVTRGGLANYIDWCVESYQLAGSRGALVHSPITFDFTLTCLLAPLTCGRTVYVCRGHSRLHALADRLSELEDVGIVKLTPTSLEPLAELLGTGLRPARVGTIVVGGEQLFASRGLFSLAESLGAQVVNEYGPTESVVGSTAFRMNEPWVPGAPVPIGRTIAQTTVRVLRPDGDAAETWTEGEIQISGRGVARGYLGAPRLTAAAFVPDRGSVPGARAYRTGDRAQVTSTGDLVYVGRHDDQVKIRGHRVELNEVAATIRRHPAIAECAVFVHRRGLAEQLVAVFVPRNEGAIDSDALRAYLASVLPSHMVPAQTRATRSLPANANGKVDAHRLGELFDLRRSGRPAVPPRSDLERILLNLWEKLLQLSPIGINDDFFEVGGDSILGIQLLVRARHEGVHLRPKDLRDHPTIAGLAAVATQTPATTPPPPTASEWLPLAPSQSRFFEAGLVEPHHYNQSIAVTTQRRWRRADFERAIAGLVAHHDALRLAFELNGPLRRQRISAVGGDILSFVDVDEPIDERWEATVLEAIDSAQRSFRLDAPPLLRVVVFDRKQDVDILAVIVAHHLVVDHVSWTILLDDFRLALEQAERRENIALPTTTSFASLVSSEQARMNHTDLTAAKAYWLSSRWSDIPFAGPDAPNVSGSEDVADETISFDLDRDTTSGLMLRAASAYHTQPFDLLLAGWCRAVWRWNGSDVMAVDVEGHGREVDERSDYSRTVGWCTSIYPVYVALSHPSSLRRSIQDVKEALRAVPNSGADYGPMRYLAADAELREACARQRRCEVIFNYLGVVTAAVASASPFRWARRSLGLAISKLNRREHDIDIGAWASDGLMHVKITFRSDAPRREAMARLVETFKGELVAVVRHCLDAPRPGYTPADFPLAPLTQDLLDLIVSANPGMEDVYPLTPTQQGILLHTIEEASSGSYLVQLCIEMAGTVDEGAFRDSWRRVVARHTALRTSFFWTTPTEPLQVVNSATDVPISTLDWSPIDGADLSPRLEAWLAAERQRGLDLTRHPAQRLTLIRAGDDRLVFVWTYPHVLLDGWSNSKVLREVLDVYGALSRNELPLEPRVRPYRDFIRWLRRSASGEATAYWTRAMAGVSRGTRLALPKPACPPGPLSHRAVEVALTSVESASVAALASRLRVTPNVVVQGAWALVLGRYCGTNDVVFGVTTAGRPYELPDIEERVGLFINTLPMRVRVEPAAEVDDYLRMVSARLQELLDHEQTPLAEVHRLVGLRNGEQLFNSIVVFENYPGHVDASALPNGLRIVAVRTSERTNYDLTVIVASRGGLSIKISYAPSVDPADAARIAAHFGDTLRWMATERGRVHDLSRAWSGKTVAQERAGPIGAQCRAIHEVFEGHASIAPDTVAVVDADLIVTYGALNARANRLARYLVHCGVEPGDCVALCLDRSVELVAACLAVHKAGAAYIPIDVEFPLARVAAMSRPAKYFIVDDAGRGLVVPREGVCVVDIARDRTSIERQPTKSLGVSRSIRGQIAYVIYTSGSSGEPKGVMVTHDNVGSLFTAIFGIYEFDRAQVWSFVHSISFDFSVWEILGALWSGGRVVVVPRSVARSPEGLAALIVKHGVTVLSQTPSAFRQLLTIGSLEEQHGVDLNIRWVVFGGEALHMASLGDGAEKIVRRGARLVNMYGITETTVHVTHRVMSGRDEGGDRSYIGAALPHLGIRLLDDGLSDVPDRVAGEMGITGAGLAAGYLNAARLTAERFVPNPSGAEPGERLYRSGDLGRVAPDGGFEYLGRVDRQVKIRGFRVEPGEVRACLLRQPDVRDAVVCSVTDHAGDCVLGGFVVLADASVDGAGLLRSLRQELPSHLVPAFVRSVERFPLTANGKTDLEALRSMAAERRPTVSDVQTTWEQEAVVSTWKQVLGVERIGLQDEFFVHGGDSIKALRVVNGLRRLGLDISVDAVFRHPTVGALADFIQKVSGRDPDAALVREWAGRAGGVPTATVELPSDAVDAFPATRLQMGMLFHTSRSADEVKPYHNVSLFALEGQFDERRFRRAVDELIARHPALRSAFALEGFAVPMQVVLRTVPAPLTVGHLEPLSESEERSWTERWVRNEQNHLFQMDVAPLFRLHVMTAAGDRFYLGLTEHHAILDGWSVAAMLAELFELYVGEPQAELANDVATSDIQILRGHALLESRTLVSTRHESFWSEYLRDYPQFRLDRFGVHATLCARSAVARQGVTLDQVLANGLTSFANRSGAPLKSVLLAAHLAVIAVMSSEAEIITGLVSHTRPEFDGSDRALGLFLNTLPLRLVRPKGSWSQWVHDVFREEGRILPYRRYPFAAMRDGQGHAIALTTAFNFVNFHVLPRMQPDGPLRVLQSAVHEETDFDLFTDFTLLNGTNQLDLTIAYNTSRMTAAGAELLLHHYTRCLRSMVSDPASPVLDMPAAVVSRAAPGDGPQGGDLRSLIASLDDESYQDRIALVDGQSHVSARMLGAKVHRVARALRRRGVGPEIRVAVLLEKGIPWLTVALGIIEAGGVYAPLNSDEPPERLGRILRRAGARFVVTARDLDGVEIGETSVATVEELTAAAPEPLTGCAELPSECLAYLLYTSGTTGTPRGVPMTHGALVNLLRWQDREMAIRDRRMLQYAMPGFDVSLQEALTALVGHNTLVLVRADTRRDFVELARLVRDEQVEWLFAPDTAVKALLRAIRDTSSERLALTSIVSAGEAIVVNADLAAFIEEGGALYNQYGPSETHVVTAALVRAEEAALGARPSIGTPIDRTSVSVVDGNGWPARLGTLGELNIASPGVARGYDGDARLTAERFVPNPLPGATAGQRMYRTGDIGFADEEGRLFYHARSDTQVKLRGYRIELEEVRQALVQHPEVVDAIIALGEVRNDNELCAYVVASTSVDPAEVRAFLRARLPAYMVPSLIVRVEAIPLTTNGKVDLRKLSQAEIVKEERSARGEALDAQECELRAIWQEVLQTNETIGRADDFSRLGGSSISLLHLQLQIRKHFSVNLSVATLASNSALTDMSERISEAAATNR